MGGTQWKCSVGKWIIKYEREIVYVINTYVIYTVKSSKRTGQNI